MTIRASRRGRSSGSEAVIDVGLVMDELARRRPIFHSEADFQHEFAISVRRLHPSSCVRLEKPIGFGVSGATDLVVRYEEQTIGVELKYLKKRLSVVVDGEDFELKAHGATDLRRYDVCKDVQRLEKFNDLYGGPSFAVTLTNDRAYWEATKRIGTIDEAFRLCEGRVVRGNLSWAAHANTGSVRNRERMIELSGEYLADWRLFSDLNVRHGAFRYLLFKIPQKGLADNRRGTAECQ